MFVQEKETELFIIWHAVVSIELSYTEIEKWHDFIMKSDWNKFIGSKSTCQQFYDKEQEFTQQN